MEIKKYKISRVSIFFKNGKMDIKLLCYLQILWIHLKPFFKCQYLKHARNYVLCNLQFVMSKQENSKTSVKFATPQHFFKHKSVFLHNTYSVSRHAFQETKIQICLKILVAALYQQGMSALNIVHSSIHSFAQ